jgi:PEGA domain
MLSKRVMVVAAEKPLQRRLIAGAMAAGGAVQAFGAADESPGRVETDLVLYALAQPDDAGLASLSARLPDGARVVPVLPGPSLAAMIVLLANPRVAAVLTAADLDGRTVSQVVSKLLYGDLFGPEKLLTWGVRTYSMLVGDYHEKSLAIATIGDFAQAMGVRRKHREQIDQCIDEMLMNALYDAPVDAAGQPLFAEVPVRDRVALRLTEKAILQYACDGDRFVVSVRDNFGSLKKETVLAYLDKCLHTTGAEQIDRKAGGAGLGLYLIANAASEVYFHVFGGSATEVVCSFDLASPRAQLRAFAVFEDELDLSRPGDAAARGTPARRGRRREDLVPARSGGPLLPVMMTFAVLLLITAVTLVALPYVRRPAAATLRVETEPPGATVYVDGRARGAAPLAIAGLDAGRSYAVRAALPGHRDDEQLVSAAAGESAVRLRLPAAPSVVAIESEPPGARVRVDGADTGKLTPAALDLPSGRAAAVRLERDGYAPQTLAITAPPPGERVVYRAALALSPDVAALTVTVTAPADAESSVEVDGMALVPPGAVHETFLKPGAAHRVRVTARGFVDYQKELVLGAGERRALEVTLQPGGVLKLDGPASARVFVDGHVAGSTPLAPITLAEGPHTIALKGAHVDATRKIRIERGKTTEARFTATTTSTTTEPPPDR